MWDVDICLLPIVVQFNFWPVQVKIAMWRALRICPGAYIICTVYLPAYDIIRNHGLSCHFYADDTQLYCSFKLHDQVASLQVIEYRWMDACEYVKTEQG